MKNSKPVKHREDYQKKKILPKKSMRGEPENPYGEIKRPVSFGLTPTGVNLLKQMSKDLGISTSEFLERIARGEIKIDIDHELSD